MVRTEVSSSRDKIGLAQRWQRACAFAAASAALGLIAGCGGEVGADQALEPAASTSASPNAGASAEPASTVRQGGPPQRLRPGVDTMVEQSVPPVTDPDAMAQAPSASLDPPPDWEASPPDVLAGAPAIRRYESPADAGSEAAFRPLVSRVLTSTPAIYAAEQTPKTFFVVDYRGSKLASTGEVLPVVRISEYSPPPLSQAELDASAQACPCTFQASVSLKGGQRALAALTDLGTSVTWLQDPDVMLVVEGPTEQLSVDAAMAVADDLSTQAIEKGG